MLFRCAAVLVLCFPPAEVQQMAAQTLPPSASTIQDSSTLLPAVRSYALDEVIITSQRIPRPVLFSPSATTVVSRRSIEAAGGTSLGAVLASGTGLFIKDYGGPSGIKTLAQRGLGTEHTLVLLNGMPVNSVHNGGVDLGMTSADDIERIEIVRGGQSALHGPHAVAGIVNVITRTMPDEEHAIVGMDWGAFGYRSIRLAIGNGGAPEGWQLRYAHEQSEENYPFEFRNGPSVMELYRKNADLRVDRWSAGFRTSLSPAVQLDSYATAQMGERGVPGIVAGPFSSSRARQQDRQAIVQTSVTAVLSNSLSWETRLQGQYGYQRYRDPDLVIGYTPVDNYSVSREVRVESRVAMQSAWGMRLNLGGDVTRAVGQSNAHREDATRTQWGFALAAEQRLAGEEGGMLISLYPALRYDRAGPNLDAWSPQVGVHAQIPLGGVTTLPRTILRFRGSASRNFRPPTFNELFYSGGGGVGNPLLKPERSTSLEAGSGISFVALGEHHLDVTLFVIMMDDRIVWVPAGTGSVTPKNLREVRSRGAELVYSFALGGVTLTAHYARSRSEKISADYPGDPYRNVQLIYSPEEMVGIRSSWYLDIQEGILDALECGGGYTFVGHRFVTEDNGLFLPGYHLLQAGGGVRLRLAGWRVRVRGDITNLLNTSYETMAGYPMPPRSVRLTCEILY